MGNWSDEGRALIGRAQFISRTLVFACLFAPASILLSAQPAAAFEIFGWKLFGSDEEETVVADPLNYTVTLDVAGSDPELTQKLNDASRLVADEERPVSGSLGLLSKARADRERLVAALYDAARYDGVVTVLIEGRDIDAIEPDAQFGAGPVPVAVTVEPGAVFTLGDVRLSGDAAGLDPAKYDLVPGADAGSGRILSAETAIVRDLRTEGRPLARVTNREIVADHRTQRLDVTLTVAAGPVAGFGSTDVSGTDQVERDFVAYMTGLERGKQYSPQDVDDARERLQALGVFSSVTLKEGEALDADGNVPIQVEVSERKMRYFGVGATVSNTEGLGLEGYWGHRNLFGRAEKLRIEGSISGIGDKDEQAQTAAEYVQRLNYNAKVMFEKPGVIGPASRFFSNTQVVYDHPDAYDRFSAKSSLGVAYDVTKNQTVSAEFAVDYSDITDAFFLDGRKFLIVSTPLQYVYDRRDSKLDPKSGFRLLAFAEPSFDVLNGVPFFKVKGEGSAYVSLDADGKMVAAGRLVGGSIVGASIDEIPADRRFFSGGGGSVRGYAYQGIGPKDAFGRPTGGLSYLEASAELRFAVTDTFGLVPFVDAGTVSIDNVPDFNDVKLGAGIGIRYLTPFGPLRIDGAIPLNPGPGDPDFGIYAGVGQAF